MSALGSLSFDLDRLGVVLLVSSSLVALLPALLQRLPEMFDEVISALATVDEEYASFLRSGRENALAPAEVALRRLVWSAQLSLQARADGRASGLPAPRAHGGTAAGQDADPSGDDAIWGMFDELGREQCRRGLPLQSLLSAYQAGGRAAWSYIADVAVAGGLPGDALAALADQVFSLVDELVSVTVAGYVQEQGHGPDLGERARDELVARLLSVSPDREGVVAAARRAGWRVPREAAVVLFPAGPPDGIPGLGQLLHLRHGGLPGVIVPDASAPGCRQRLAALMRGTSALVGPAVPPERLGASARLAEMAAHTPAVPDPDGCVVFVGDHLDVLIVHRDPALLAELRGRCLAPLRDVPPASRDALRCTLRAWLRHMGNRTAMAAELGIHPQTVRYRLGRLRELFGPVLDDPDFRLRLAVAVGWEPQEARNRTAATAPPPTATARRGTVAARRRMAAAAGGERGVIARPGQPTVDVQAGRG